MRNVVGNRIPKFEVINKLDSKNITQKTLKSYYFINNQVSAEDNEKKHIAECSAMVDITARI